jgi:hypothetical protein
MIIEMRTYILKPGSVPEWLRVYEAEGMPVQTRILGNLIGYFYSEIGPMNQIVHLWGYESFEDRQRRRAELGKDPVWQACLAKISGLIVTQENKLMMGAPFSPIR